MIQPPHAYPAKLRRPPAWSALATGLAVLVLVGCQAAAGPAASASPIPPSLAGMTLAGGDVAGIGATPGVSGASGAVATSGAAATLGVTLPPGFQTPANTDAQRLLAPTPFNGLQFIFPTPIAYAAPASWRPPVLSVPLSVRPDDHYWFARPIASDSVNYPLGTYRYGSNYFGQMNIHAGIDIDAPPYTPVLAAGPGRVVWSGYGLFDFQPGRADDPYGNAVAIEHDFGYHNQLLYTVYAHMAAHNVFVGQQVKTGDVIGWIGNTGNSSGPHLHFEVREGSNLYFNTRNPELWIAPYAGWGVLAGRLITAGGQPIPATDIDIYDASGKFVHKVSTYGPHIAHPDDAWRENFAISDLPAGMYYLQAYIAVSDTETDTVEGQATVIAGQTNFVVLQSQAGVVIHRQADNNPPSFLPTFTPSYTPTPTDTPIPTDTRTPTATRTATSTRSPTDTPTASRTPWWQRLSPNQPSPTPKPP